MNFSQLPDSSRVWIYQSSRLFDQEELIALQKKLDDFCIEWTSHNRQLHAAAMVLYQRFIILAVDENAADASGCSIDKSVHFMQKIEQAFHTNLFDRMTFAYQNGETISLASREEFAQLYKNGVINDETIVFDNLVNDKANFEQTWKKPLIESWHKRMV